MQKNGLLSAKGFSRLICHFEKKVDQLAKKEAYRTVLRIVFCILPALLSSFLLPLFAPGFVLLTALVTYKIFSNQQEILTQLSDFEKHWCVFIPSAFIFITWAMALNHYGRPDQITRTVGSVVLVLMVALKPIFFGKNSVKSKRVPYKLIHLFVVSLVGIQQILIVIGGL